VPSRAHRPSRFEPNGKGPGGTFRYPNAYATPSAMEMALEFVLQHAPPANLPGCQCMTLVCLEEVIGAPLSVFSHIRVLRTLTSES